LAYRDNFRIFLPFLASRLKKSISALELTDLNAKNVIAYLSHLEEDRGNSVWTRNARLAAIRAFLNYTAVEVLDALPDIKRTLAIPQKRKNRPVLEYLDKVEIEALLAAPDQDSWSGQRDHILLLTMYNTGARVSEIIDIRRQDLDIKGKTQFIYTVKDVKKESFHCGKKLP
jgi:integrase/recombinase XerD